MNFIVGEDKGSNEAEQDRASFRESNAGKRARRPTSVESRRGVGRRIVAWTTGWLARRRLERDQGRLALADIDESDLSEFGRRVRAEVVRERRALELQERVGKCPAQAPPGSNGVRSLWFRVMRIYRTLAAWQFQTRMHAELMALDDRTLKDVGLTRADVLTMLMKGRSFGKSD